MQQSPNRVHNYWGVIYIAMACRSIMLHENDTMYIHKMGENEYLNNLIKMFVMGFNGHFRIYMIESGER